VAADLTERPLASETPQGEGRHLAQATPSGAQKTGGTGPGAWTAVGRILSTAAMIIALFTAMILIVIPVITGSHTYTVLTNSMAPKFPPGTFLVMKPVAFDDIQYGDVVTFQLYSGRPEVETHRVVGFGATQQGEKTLITKGDNNSANDAEPVREIQLKGKLFYAVPYVGFLANALGHADRDTWTIVAAMGLIGYGAILVFKSVHTSRRSRTVEGK
jgi:signal peptidase I